jgi:hypothetical protein
MPLRRLFDEHLESNSSVEWLIEKKKGLASLQTLAPIGGGERI